MVEPLLCWMVNVLILEWLMLLLININDGVPMVLIINVDGYGLMENWWLTDGVNGG